MGQCIIRNKKGHLQIEGKRISSLIKDFGTPLFIVCEKHLRKKYREFKHLFTSYYPKTIVSYSYKTNYLPFICKILKEERCWAEVTSSMELNIAKKIGQDFKKIIFNGPAKTDQELLEAIQSNIAILNVDSLNELKKIIFLSKKYNLKANIGFRVNVSPFLKTRKWSKFGIDIDDLFKACELTLNSKNLKYMGLHAHLGTQITTIEPYKKLIKQMVDISKKIHERYNLSTEFIDIGGGFPVENLPPLKNKVKKIPSIENFSNEICLTLKKEITKADMKLPTLILEPGRSLISSPVFLLLKVITTKEISKIGKIAIVDGGLNILPESEYYRYEIIPNIVKGKKELIQIAGPLCMEEDLIGINRKLPTVHEGDILVVLNAGSYSISLSWQFIKTRPAVVLIDRNKTIKVIRKSENIGNVLNLDCFQ